jgi:lysozyme family protein
VDKNWKRAIGLILEADKGRPGLTLVEHNAFREHHGDPPLARVTDATGSEIETIYRLSYWMPFVPALPSGLDYFFFDTAICTGVPEAIRAMQRALLVEPDGHLGIVTTQAIFKVMWAGTLCEVLDGYASQRALIRAVGRDFQEHSARIEFALEQAKAMVDHH